MRKLTITALGLAAIAVSGCALTTASLPGDERSFSRSLSDVNAGRAIRARFKRADGFHLDNVDVAIEQGIVVLTGVAPREEDLIEAERIAWSAPEVVQVGNEIALKAQKGMLQATQDGLLQSKVKARLTADKSVRSRNINIETVDGVVYLLGVARTPAELERAAYIASTTKGTKEVISYIKIPDANLQNAAFVEAPTPQTQDLPSYRELPDSLTHNAVPPGHVQAERSTGAPQDTEPYYRDPKTGERITLPPGTVTIPYNPGAESGGAPSAPHYTDPETGQQIPIKYFRQK